MPDEQGESDPFQVDIAAAEAPYTVYVLSLENDKFYVGNAKNVRDRIEKHREGKASWWTERHPPTGVKMAKGRASHGDAKALEYKLAEEYVNRYGLARVRGGPWIKPDGTKSDHW